MRATLHHNGQTTRVAASDWLDQIETLDVAAVLFDCDGTLVDSAAAHTLCLQDAVRDQGFELTAQWYAPRSGLDRRAILNAFKHDIAPALDVEIAVHFSIARFKSHIHTVSPIVATTDLIKPLLKAGYRLAVVTNSERQIATQSLRRIGVLKHLHDVVCICDGLPAKPAPQMFQHAAALLGVPPHKALVFEDSPQGVQAAIAATMPVFEVVGTAHTTTGVPR